MELIVSKAAQQKNIIKPSGVSIGLSREHSEFAKEIEDCFEDLNVSVKAAYMRCCAEDLPIQVYIFLGGSVASGVIYDLLKTGIKKVFSKFKKAHVSVRDSDGIIYNIKQRGKINILVVPERIKEFEHIKNIDDLIQHLKEQENKKNLDI